MSGDWNQGTPPQDHRFGLQKTFTTGGATTLQLSFNYRATSSSTAYPITNFCVMVSDQAGNLVYFQEPVAGSNPSDTGWLTFSPITLWVGNTSSVTVIFFLADGWSFNYNQTIRVDHVVTSFSGAAPNAPSALGQYLPDGVTAIPTGGYTPTANPVFTALVSDPDAPQNVDLEAEIRPTSVSFSGVPNTGSGLAASGQTAQTSAVTFGGKFGSALTFDGVDDYALSPSLGSALTSYTVEAWFKPAVGGGCLVVELGQSSLSSGFGTGYSVANLYVDAAGQVWADVSGVSSVSLGNANFWQWNYAVMTWNNSTLTLSGYLNGVAASTPNVGSSRLSPSAEYFALGARSFALRSFRGAIDELRVSKVVRSSAEVASAWNAGAGSAFTSDSNTVLLYHLDEGSGQTVSDSSGGGFNGTLGPSTSAESADPTWENALAGGTNLHWQARAVDDTGTPGSWASYGGNGDTPPADTDFTVGPLSAPSLTSLGPTSGKIAGGDTITLTGTNFVSGATVSFGGSAGTSVTFVSSTKLTAVTPAHAAGAVNVVVTNPDGQSSTLTNGFTYVAPPSLTGLSPTSGKTAGGDTITLTGTNFVSGATVSFGGSAGTSVTFVSSTKLTAVTPAHAAGAVNVVVTNPDGQTSTLTNGFTYVAPPSLTGLSPPSGKTAGGDTITLTGTNFVSGATVSFGGSAGTSVNVVSSTSITVVTTSHAAGAANVVVTNPDGQSSTLTSGFTYIAPPSLTSLSPTSGKTPGGDTITLTGTNFVSGATVSFGGSLGTDVTFVDSTTLTVTTPFHVMGPVDLVVTNPDGQESTLNNAFTFIDAPALTSVFPAVGPTGGGTTVSLTGSGFVPGTTVTINKVLVQDVFFVDANTLTFMTPAHSPGLVDLSVTNPDGQSSTLTQAYTYQPDSNQPQQLPSIYHLKVGCDSSSGGSNGLGWLMLMAVPWALRSRRARHEEENQR